MKRLFFALFSAVMFSAFVVTNVQAEDQTGKTGVTVTFGQGELILNQVPEIFDFGILPISTATVVRSLPREEKKEYNLVVTDTRGSETGYSVSVRTERLSAKEVKLQGNNISLIKPEVRQLTDSIHSKAPVVRDEFFADAVDGEGNAVPTVISTARNFTPEGSLTWQAGWAADHIRLIVQPGEASALSYYTTIVWTLSDVPVA
ncbi:MAG: WxL domain-containing protein [Culicoidibacterales bacterium]